MDLANQLRGSLLTFDGTQHTVVFQGDSCVDDYVTAVSHRRHHAAERREVLAPADHAPPSRSEIKA